MVVVACLEITLGVSWSQSLKDKRMVVRSLTSKVRNKFNVSIHEVDALDHRQQIVLAITTASNSKPKIQSVFEHIVNFIESDYDVSIDDVHVEFF